MNLRRIAAALLVAALLAGGPTVASAGGTDATGASPYIVVLRDGADPDSAATRLVTSFGARVTYTYRFALNGLAVRIPSNLVGAVAADPNVVSIVPDAPVVASAAQPLPAGVNRVDADLSPTALLSGTNAGVDQRVNVDVAILDSGIDLNHPDLNVMASRKKSCTGSTGEDAYGHGTQMAGIVGALDNSYGASASRRAPGSGRSRS